LDGLYDTADLVVGQLGKRREEFLIADRDLLLVRGATLFGRMDVCPGKPVAISEMVPMFAL
jgi:hypothetical protein